MFKKIKLVVTSFFLLCFSFKSFSQAANNVCNPATPITTINPSGDCTPVAGNLYQATAGASVSPAVNPTSTCGTVRDVWYQFTVPANATSVTINVSLTSSPTSLSTANTFVEVFNTSTCTAVAPGNTRGCFNISASRIYTGLTGGNTYLMRVFTTANTTSSPSNWGFNLCITSNDNCATAKTLTVGTASSSSVWGATASSGIPAGCISGTPDDDVWFKFTPQTTSASISLTGIGSNLNTSGARMQVLSGSCGSLSSVACGATSVVALNLIPGNVYYIRVYSAGNGSIGGTEPGSVFNITVANPPSLTQSSVGSGRMKEIFQQTIISPVDVLNNPWEIAYGPDGNLWVTESRGYKVNIIDPNTGLKINVLDIGYNSTFLPVADRPFNLQFDFNAQGNPQGGLAGLAIHPEFNAATPKRYVYISYIHKYTGLSTTTNGGKFFVNQIVRFTYNPVTSRLESPVSLCDTLPGSSDHNSQRMIIAPVNGVNYLFYASGDMGSGQFTNLVRPMKAQNVNSYEGKILRFNLESDGDAGLDQWIPNDNPFSNSAVWSTGIRNNQGFAYAKINGTDFLYGASHGPFSDDEINIIEKAKNYGHPLVVGYSTDGNYNGAAAGPSNGSCDYITSEATNAAAIGSSYRDPIFSFYPAPKGSTTIPWSIQYIYTDQDYSTNAGHQGAQGANGFWASEGIAGMDIYTNNVIPGWKNSLLLGTLKGGKTMRLKLNALGTNIMPVGGSDTIAYFRSVNRFRDIAIAPDGRSIFTIIDKSSTTSGPTTGSPVVSACAGCMLKYTFLGYADASGKSSIPNSIDVTLATATNTIIPGNEIVINSSNNNLWVPINGPDGNILAEIKANGNNLGTVTSTFYISGASREDAARKLYMNRSITINPQNQPATPVSVRLYFTNSEFEALRNATNSQGLPSGVTSISDIKIRKNNDATAAALTAVAEKIEPQYAETFGSGGYVLQANISSFSTFYFGNPDMITLPLVLVEFKGSLQNGASYLQWKTEHERNTHHFVVERSTDGRSFKDIGTVDANGIGGIYNYTDYEAGMLAAEILYYRLRMIDIDQEFAYSKVISLTNISSSSATVYPNPIRDELNVSLTLANADQIKIQVTDINGRVVYAERKAAGIGTTAIKINTKKWSAQTYTITVTGSDNKVLVNKKLVKM